LFWQLGYQVAIKVCNILNPKLLIFAVSTDRGILYGIFREIDLRSVRTVGTKKEEVHKIGLRNIS